MLAHRWTPLMWPLLGRMSGTSEGTDVTCMHTRKQHERAVPVLIQTATTQTTAPCPSRTPSSEDGKIQRHRRVECVFVCMCEYMHSTCGCLVLFPMNCINPYADWEKSVLFPISSWLTAVYLWVCKHRPTGASDSHTHSHRALPFAI